MVILNYSPVAPSLYFTLLKVALRCFNPSSDIIARPSPSGPIINVDSLLIALHSYILLTHLRLLVRIIDILLIILRVLLVVELLVRLLSKLLLTRVLLLLLILIIWELGLVHCTQSIKER